MNSRRPSRVLFVNPFGIGDVLFSTPLVRAVKRAFPGADISYICNKRAYEILKNNADIKKLFVYEKDEYRALWDASKIRCLKKIDELLKDIRRDRYDVVIDMSLGYIYSLCFMLFTGIKERVGFNYRDRGRFLTKKLTLSGFNDKHVIEYYLTLGEMLGVPSSGRQMTLAIPGSVKEWADVYLGGRGVAENDKICGIIPGCGASWGSNARYRRWSPWKFAEVIDHVSRRFGMKIIMFGEEKEKSICDEVARLAHATVLNTCGELSLEQAASLIDRCEIVVTNDGGPVHMAVALKKKTVAIFGPVDEKIYGPYPPDDRFIVVTGDVPCRPCYRNFKHKDCQTLNCLKEIRPEAVCRAVDTLLEKR